MKVSVIVPCFREEQNIQTCLGSLIAQDYQDSYEILVVDNDSPDRTPFIIREMQKKSPKIRLIVEEKRGTAAGRNTGIRNARYEHIVFIDADCAAPPDWLSILVRNYQWAKSNGDGVIGVGGRNIAPREAPPFVKAIEIVLDSYAGSFRSIQGRQFKTQNYVPSLSLTNALYEREKIVEAGGFDESLRSEAEDADLNHRLLAGGGKFLYVPDSFVWHNMRPSPKSWFRNMFRYGKGRARLLKRHPSMRKPFYLLPVLFLPAMLSVSLVCVSPIFVLPLLYFPFLAGLSCVQSIKHRSPNLLHLILVVYVIQHFGYASGEIYGLLHPKVC